jgi:hypothetical protein
LQWPPVEHSALLGGTAINCKTFSTGRPVRNMYRNDSDPNHSFCVSGLFCFRVPHGVSHSQLAIRYVSSFIRRFNVRQRIVAIEFVESWFNAGKFAGCA